MGFISCTTHSLHPSWNQEVRREKHLVVLQAATTKLAPAVLSPDLVWYGDDSNNNVGNAKTGRELFIMKRNSNSSATSFKKRSHQGSVSRKKKPRRRSKSRSKQRPKPAPTVKHNAMTGTTDDPVECAVEVHNNITKSSHSSFRRDCCRALAFKKVDFGDMYAFDLGKALRVDYFLDTSF